MQHVGCKAGWVVLFVLLLGVLANYIIMYYFRCLVLFLARTLLFFIFGLNARRANPTAPLYRVKCIGNRVCFS